MDINVIASTNQNTVVSQYNPIPRTRKAYQSEAELEQELIDNLVSIGYEYLTINDEKDLLNNLKKQLEKLNNTAFSDDEWDSIYKNKISNSNLSIKEKAKIIQQDYIYELVRDDGSLMNVYLINKDDIHKNSLQVINQYVQNQGAHDTRYDVTVLVNGLPLVHIELKRRGVAIREAFNQINRYQRDSFWAGSGLYEFIQIFVISNGTYTKYYSNTTRDGHVKKTNNANASKKKSSDSFEFTSYWADANNKNIIDLVDFTYTFLTKHTLLNIITKYCVFTVEEKLLVMRPYQIVATERILNRIKIAINYKKEGTIDAGGYIWHTTGSGKTLTSFKTAQLVTKIPEIDKVLFVVDRKDLDYQTMCEYDKFEKGAANGNRSTRVLQRQLEDNNSRIIVTTIQKLSTFIKKNKTHDIYNKRVVMIFDECHRSQFGEMHIAIIKSFNKYYIFGFTGTPIFAANTSGSSNPKLMTTMQAFGDKLHTYTIVNAIADNNVLPFRIDYVNTIKENVGIDEEVQAINKQKALESPERISEIVKYVLDRFDRKTKRNEHYSLQGKRVNGFNSIFAVDSIPMAMKYYSEFKKQLDEKNNPLTIATIYSFNPNEADPDEIFSDEDFDTSGLDVSSRDFLDKAISDYNETFATNFDSSSEGFQNYYKDVAQRLKNKELDMIIVVNMFLTGFDSKTLNTLWVDKSLKYHGLIQAFSRTNRILNSVKTYGNIVCFRDLEGRVEEAISLFGDKDAESIVLLKSFLEYYNGYDENGKHVKGYVELINYLTTKYPVSDLGSIVTQKDKVDFVKLFGNVLRLTNILSAFDEFEGKELLTQADNQNYHSAYLDIYRELKVKKDEEDINDDLVFEIELIKQVDVNIDYILQLVTQYHDDNCQDKELLAQINRTIDASIQLKSKKELIIKFIDNITNSSMLPGEWKTYITKCCEDDLNTIITKYNLKVDETTKYINDAFKHGSLKTTGADYDAILPKMSRFGGKKAKVKAEVTEELIIFFEKYFDII